MIKVKRHEYTDEQIAFLRQHKDDRNFVDKFNSRYDLNISRNALRQAMLRRKILSTDRNHFKKGQIPWNKGKTGYMAANKTSFKKGGIPPNWRPVGSERAGKDNMIEIKVAEPNKWKSKHRHIFENHYGPIPPSHIVIFLDSDNRNFDIDNLYCISRAVNAQLSRDGLHILPANIKETTIHAIELKLTVNRLENENTTKNIR